MKSESCCSREAAIFYISGTLGFIFLSFPFVFLIDLIPTIDTGFIWLQELLYRQGMYTTHYSPSKLIYWMFMLNLGFAFVNIIAHKNERKCAFKSRDGSYKDIKMLQPLGLILYFFSPIIFLRAKNDLSGYCEDALQGIGKDECHIYSHMEVFLYNYLAFVVPYFIGLNFGRLDHIPGMWRFALEWEIMKTWPLYLWVIFVMLILLILGNGSLIFKMYYEVGKFWHYTIFVIALVGGIMIITELVKEKRVFHLHHFAIGLLLLLITAIQVPFVTILAALLTGLMMEGICTWGIGWIWDIKPTLIFSSKDYITEIVPNCIANE